MQEGSFDPGKKRSFDPGREWTASVQRGSWSFRLGQTVRREEPSIQGRGLPFDHGSHGFRSSTLMGSIQRRALLRSGMLYLQKHVSEIKYRAWVLNPRPFDPALVGSLQAMSAASVSKRKT